MTLIKCSHGVYDPHGDQSYCSVCNPAVVLVSTIAEIKQSGSLEIAVPKQLDEPTSETSEKWENDLESHGLAVRQLNLQEEIIEEDDDTLRFSDIEENETGVHLSHESSKRQYARPTNLSNNRDMEILRSFVDSDDPLINGGHQIKKIRTRQKDIPIWATNDFETQKLLLSAFPRLATDAKQRKRAARWARTIHLFYRMGSSRSQVAAEMKLKPNKIKKMIINMGRVFRGVQANNKGPRGLKPRGRPKKQIVTPSKPLL